MTPSSRSPEKTMSCRSPAILLAVVAVHAACPALAQTAPPAAAAPGYRSALEGYRPFADQEVAPWKESNDNVGRIGGWRAYAREAQGAASGPRPARAPATPASGHRHH
jgi:hypothetical protein